MEEDLAAEIVDAAWTVYSVLGPGLLEKVYELSLYHELTKRDIRVRRQVPVAVRYDTVTIEAGFRIDLIAEDSVIIEVKAVSELHPVHKAQLLTYLKCADQRLGLLINFGAATFRGNVRRVVNGL